MNIAEYIAYFEAAARSNKRIAHGVAGKKAFKRLDIEELITGLKSGMDKMSLFLENPTIKTYDAKSDNPRKMMTGAFVILDHAKKGDFDHECAILDATWDVTEQMYEKLVNDVAATSMNPAHPHKIKGFDLNSLESEKVGPVFDNMYGWRTTFTINQTFRRGLKLNNDDWTNDTKFTP